jgi:hypothetical protein
MHKYNFNVSSNVHFCLFHIILEVLVLSDLHVTSWYFVSILRDKT